MRKTWHYILTMLVISLAVALLSACGHTHAYIPGAVLQEPGCESEGQQMENCECGQTNTVVIPAKGHTYGEWVTTREAGCITDGEQAQKCACGATLTQTIPQTGHTYADQITREPACDGEGIKTFTCAGCSDSYEEKIPPTTYPATELYNMTVDSVCEIVTYDKKGSELALGSGFVYEEDGKIITNFHVIEGAASAKLSFGETTYTVEKVLAYDKNIDVAVLQISATGLTKLPVCKKDHAVGSVVYALGNSKGLTSTFSDGMITYANRETDGVHHVQHDAPISGGNSGGPLINEYGEVIGINTWTVRDSQNLNFAVHMVELDNLNYGTPMTMQEFYEQVCDSFQIMKDCILAKGEKSGTSYIMDLDTGYYSGTKYDCWTSYSTEMNTITMAVLMDDITVGFVLEEDLNGEYLWLGTYEDLEMYGELLAIIFTPESDLTYSSTNVTDSETVSLFQSLLTEMMHVLLDKGLPYFEDYGVTYEDLGFYMYY